MSPIKQGTARRLGIRSAAEPLTLAHISGSPHGPLRAVVTWMGRSFMVNAKGSAVRDAGFIVGSGQINDIRVPSCRP